MGMREKVARALNDADGTREWEDAGSDQEWYRNLATAAIEAMMEPTPGMLEAGYNAKEQPGMADNQRELHSMKMAPRWQAMIRAALSEGQRFPISGVAGITSG